MYTYKNKTDQDLVLVGHGVVKAGEEFTSVTIIENPNIEFVSQEQNEHTNSVVGTEAPQPNAVTDAHPVNQENNQGIN